jgi:putative transposase
MAIPYRGVTSSSTYFLTAGTYNKTHILQSERMAELFCEVLFRYRDAGKFSLHAFVIMPNHIHLLLTVPEGLMLERTMQLIKGGFSYEAGKRFDMRGVVWQKSYVDRRVRDAVECSRFREYIHQNPVRAGLVAVQEKFAYSSASERYQLDEVPQRLKPVTISEPIMHR